MKPLIEIIKTDNEINIIEEIMKNQFLELQILCEELGSEYKALNHNAVMSKSKSIKKLEKTIEKIKALDLDSELKILKSLNP